MTGHVSLVDLQSGKWRLFDPVGDFDADELKEMLASEGELLVASTRGVHRFDPKTDTWQYLDPRCALRNTVFHSAAIVGEELWIGYARQSFGVWGQQGISRFNERTRTWQHMLPDELGTAQCGSPDRRVAQWPGLGCFLESVLGSVLPCLGSSTFARESSGPRALGLWADSKWTFPAESPPTGRPAGLFSDTGDMAAVGRPPSICNRGWRVRWPPTMEEDRRGRSVLHSAKRRWPSRRNSVDPNRATNRQDA